MGLVAEPAMLWNVALFQSYKLYTSPLPTNPSPFPSYVTLAAATALSAMPAIINMLPLIDLFTVVVPLVWAGSFIRPAPPVA